MEEVLMMSNTRFNFRNRQKMKDTPNSTSFPQSRSSSCVICGNIADFEESILPNHDDEHINQSNLICKLLDISDTLVAMFFVESKFCTNCDENIREMGRKLKTLEKIQKEIEDYKSLVDVLIRENFEVEVPGNSLGRLKKNKEMTLENLLKIYVSEQPSAAEAFPKQAEFRRQEGLGESKGDLDEALDIKEEVEEFSRNENEQDNFDVPSHMEESDQDGDGFETDRDSDSEEYSEEDESETETSSKKRKLSKNNLKKKKTKCVQSKQNPKGSEETLTPLQILKKKRTTPTIPCGIGDCLSVLLTEAQKDRHVQMYHSEEGLESRKKQSAKLFTWKCLICIRNGLTGLFPSQTELKLHRRTHPKMILPPGPWTCEICKRTFTNPRPCEVRKHMKRHSNVNEPILPTCEFCSMKFQSQDELSTHELLHQTECPFQCVICSIVTTNSSDLSRHMLTEHPEALGKNPEAIFKCEFEGCGKIMFNKRNFKTHVNRHKVRAGEIPGIKCDKCDYVGCTPGDMTCHKRTHAEGKTHQCDLCGMQYKNKSNLGKHLNYHKGVNFKCKICGKSFPEAHTLKVHEETHSGVSHLCDICGKSCTTSTNLAHHRVIHFRDIYPVYKRKKKVKVNE